MPGLGERGEVRALPQGLTPVDADALAGDPARVGADEEPGEGSDVVDRADAVQRDRCGVRDLYDELIAGPVVGSALFREALTDVADGIRSAAEADLKDLLVKSRLPMPLFNASVYDGSTFIARPDAWWPELGVAVEVDSHEWHMSPEDHTRTLARSRRMGVAQILVLSFTPKQIRSQPAQVIQEIRRTLEGARGRPPLNLRTIPDDAGQLARPVPVS